MWLSNAGKMRLAVLALVLDVGCRTTRPPAIEICAGDGLGGADCSEKDNSRKYRSPAELENYWMTNQDDMAAFAAWCYKSDIPTATKALETMKLEIRGPSPSPGPTPVE